MSVEEVSALLAEAPSAARVSASAKDAVAQASDAPLPAVELSAEDMMTKVYGVISPDVSKEQCSDMAHSILRLRPEEDNAALWLDSADGYVISYSGMQPEVSAMARFGEDSVSDFCFFFLFPYEKDSKDDSTRRQADFCGSLLQEMHDIGMMMGRNSASDDLFEAMGDYKGNFVDVRLMDDRHDGENGRYILILSVEPQGFTPADDIYADL